MKRLTISAILILTAAAFAVPQYLTYQGVLRDSSGNLLTGTKAMSFSIYSASSGGTLIYGPQNESSVSVSNGNYTVQLGAVNSTSIFTASGDRYLEIAVGDSLSSLSTLSPRLKINSVAYAIRAEAADSIGTNAVATASIQDGAVTGAKIGTGTVTNANLEGNITGGKLASNISITTTATIDAFAIKGSQLFSKGLGDNYFIGAGTIDSGTGQVQITNPIVSGANCLIFVTPKTRSSSGTYEALASYKIGGNYYVGLSRSGALAPEAIDFNYLIVKY